MTRAVLLVAVSALSSAVGALQTPTRDVTTPVTTGTAQISGTVTTTGSPDRPVRRATVALSDPVSGLRLTTVTNDAGAFAFVNLPAGRYNLAASRTSFVPISFGATRPGRPGTSIVLAADEKKSGLSLKLLPGAVITGVVRSTDGGPTAGAQVMVLRQSYSYQTGEKTLVRAGGGLGVTTDDRGVYRVFGLPPDDYFIVAILGLGGARADVRQITPEDVQWASRVAPAAGQAPPTFTPPPAPGRSVDYAPVFYPGTPIQSNAATISLKAGEERSGADIVLQLAQTAKITGTVVSPDGKLPASLQVNTVAHDRIPGVPYGGVGTIRPDPGGKFASGGLPPGQYTVTARATDPAVARGAGSGAASGTAPLFGLTTVLVDGKDIDVTVTLQAGVTVSGRLVFDSTALAPPKDLSRIRVNLTPVVTGTGVSIGVGAVTPDATGVFSFRGVAPGGYLLSASASGWLLHSAMVGTTDAVDVPFDVATSDVEGAVIRFSDQKSELSGSLIDGSGRPAPDYFIILFPADKTLWRAQSRRIQAVRPGADGRYTIASVPSGDYQLAAVTDVEQMEWFNPAFLDSLKPASLKVTIGRGEKKVQDLKISGS